jgi:hypothetical protein
MGWRLWKTFRFGPLHTTLSNRGVGWNIGTSFLRFGVGPSGARYVLMRIPGTGIGFIKYLGQPFQRHARGAPLPHTVNQTSLPPLATSPPQVTLTRNQEILREIEESGRRNGP